MPGAAWDIGVGPTNDVWVIGTNAEGGGYGIYNWDPYYQSWTKVDGSAVRIAVGPTGPWVVNKQGAIYQRLDNKWHKYPGFARDIGVSASGVVWITSHGDSIYKWNGNTWVKSLGLATDISVNA